MIRCPLNWLTGLECPFCGGQRMIVALAHGELGEAFWLNPVLMIMSPYLLLWLLSTASKRVSRSRAGAWATAGRTEIWAAAIMIAWGVIRNIV